MGTCGGIISCAGTGVGATDMTIGIVIGIVIGCCCGGGASPVSVRFQPTSAAEKQRLVDYSYPIKLVLFCFIFTAIFRDYRMSATSRASFKSLTKDNV